MEFIYQFISVNLASALSWTLMHSVWQISLIGLILYLLRRGIKDEHHVIKYWTALGAMVSSFIVCAATFMYYFRSIPPQGEITEEMVLSLEGTSGAPAQSGIVESGMAYLLNNQELLITMWFVGFAFLLFRFVLGLYQTNYIKSTASNIFDPKLLVLFEQLKQQMNISKNVAFAESKRISTAIVAGYWQPMILFPVCMLNQLNHEEVKAILAHELAHIKRNDFIVNIFQTLVELVLYYHPVIWWMSTVVNEEREICCDDLALGATGNQHAFAKALVKLQEYRITQNLSLALSFSGNKHEFKNRIFRILDQPMHSQLNKERTFAIASVMMIALAFSYTDIDKQNTFCEPEECYEWISECVEPVIENKVIVITRDCNDDYESELNVEHIFATVPSAIKKLQIRKSFNPMAELVVNIVSSDTIPEECNPRIQKHGYFLRDFDGNLDSLMSQFNENFDFDFEMPHIEFHKLNMDSLLELHFDEKKMSSLFERLEENEFLQNEKLAELFEDFDWESQHFDNDIFEKQFEENHLFHEDSHSRKHPLFKRDFSEVITDQLLKDGYINEGENYKFEITGKHLKINGEKQPQTIWNKYSKIFEDHMGMPINEQSKIVIETKADRKQSIF